MMAAVIQIGCISMACEPRLPVQHLPTLGIGLKPLLLTASGQRITTRASWDQYRQTLHAAWLERLGSRLPSPMILPSSWELVILNRITFANW